MGIDRKVTIITPAYNAEKNIEACLLSVAGQSYPDKEHLIIDGASTDGTLEIIKRYAEKYSHIKLISEKDDGIYDAMNKGIDLASGEWIYFLGCDDVFYDGKVLEDIFSLDAIDSFDVIYGNVLWGDTGLIYDGKFSLLKLMIKNIGQQAIFHKRSLFSKFDKFDLRYRILSDHAFNMKWFNDDSVRRQYVDKIITMYATDGLSTTCVDVVFQEEREAIVKEYFPKEYSENYSRMRELERVVSEQQQHIVHQNTRISELENAIAALQGSVCWRVTAPLRKIHAHLFANRRSFYDGQ